MSSTSTTEGEWPIDEEHDAFGRSRCLIMQRQEQRRK